MMAVGARAADEAAASFASCEMLPELVEAIGVHAAANLVGLWLPVVKQQSAAATVIDDMGRLGDRYSETVTAFPWSLPVQ